MLSAGARWRSHFQSSELRVMGSNPCRRAQHFAYVVLSICVVLFYILIGFVSGVDKHIGKRPSVIVEVESLGLLGGKLR